MNATVTSATPPQTHSFLWLIQHQRWLAVSLVLAM